MIVQCIDIYNNVIKQYLKGETNGGITKGKHYNVLEVLFGVHGIMYRVICDDAGLYGHSILSRAKDFKIISAALPSNWILDTREQDDFQLTPEKWCNDSLWEWSFWQDYGEDTPAALTCFRDELKTIIAADKDYIATMIEERKGYVSWNETMLPLLNEILYCNC